MKKTKKLTKKDVILKSKTPYKKGFVYMMKDGGVAYEKVKPTKEIKAWALVITKHAGKGRIMDNRIYDTRRDAYGLMNTRYSPWKKMLKVSRITIHRD